MVSQVFAQSCVRPLLWDLVSGYHSRSLTYGAGGDALLVHQAALAHQPGLSGRLHARKRHCVSPNSMTCVATNIGRG